jgi:hypothetical protein
VIVMFGLNIAIVVDTQTYRKSQRSWEISYAVLLFYYLLRDLND